MCKGLGLDLCAVSRMVPLVRDDRFLARFFTSEETAYILDRGQGAAQSMAGIYAAKEAALKALGTGLSLPLQEVEICHTASGQPQIRLLNRAAKKMQELGGGSLFVTITHEGDMAAAAVLWQA